MARPLSADLCKRLARLLPLLASDQPGEVTAAASAITRLLKSAERDWHDLVYQLTVEPPPDRRNPRRAPPMKDYPGSQAIASDYVLELIGAIRASRCHLTTHARGFLVSLEARATTRAMVFFTAKQWDWFVKLLQAADPHINMDPS